MARVTVKLTEVQLLVSLLSLTLFQLSASIHSVCVPTLRFEVLMLSVKETVAPAASELTVSHTLPLPTTGLLSTCQDE